MGEYRESSCGGRQCCSSGKIERAPAGADTTAVVGKNRVLLREQSLLWQWGNIEKVPAGAGTAAAVGKYREGSCWSRHCCGSEENSWWGFLWWRGAVGKGNGPLWVVEGRGGGGLGNGEGRGREEKRLLLERALLRQWGNVDSAPAGADTAAAVGKYR